MVNKTETWNNLSFQDDKVNRQYISLFVHNIIYAHRIMHIVLILEILLLFDWFPKFQPVHIKNLLIPRVYPNLS